MSTSNSLLHGFLALFLASGFALMVGEGRVHRAPAGHHGTAVDRTSIYKADTTDEWDSDVVKGPHSAPVVPAGTGSGSGS